MEITIDVPIQALIPNTGVRAKTSSSVSPTALYLFAGLQRKSDVAHHLKEFGWKVQEVDILRNKNHDLTKASFRRKLQDQIAAGSFQAVIPLQHL